MSIVLKPEIKNLNKLTIMAAMAVQRAIKKLGVATKIKFPNDLQYKGKKICGILTENIFKNNEIEKMVIGIGVNTNNNVPKSLTTEDTESAEKYLYVFSVLLTSNFFS